MNIHFEKFSDIVDYFKNKIVDKEEFLKFLKEYYCDYSEIKERKNIIIFIFDDFDIKILFRKLSNKNNIQILNIVHC